MKKIKFIFILVMLFAVLTIPHIVNANENMYVDFLCAYPNSERNVSQIKKITSRNFYDDGTYRDFIREFVRNDTEKTITVYLDGTAETVLYLDDADMVSGYASTGYDFQSHYVYYYDDEITVYEGRQDGGEFHIKRDGSCIRNASTVYASKPDREYKYDNNGRIVYSKGKGIESWIEYYDSTSQPVVPAIKCEIYNGGVSPDTGYTNYNDNDKTGTPFTFWIETSTNVKDIYVMTENNIAKIPSSDFNYLSGPVLDGEKLLWTFELNMNQAGMRTLTIYGVDENGNISNGKPISFEVIPQKPQQLDAPNLYIDGKKISANNRISVHKSDNLILSWDSVPNADKYTVYVWGVNNNEPLYNGYAKTFQIDKNILEYADYGITVYANSSSKQYTQSECWFVLNVAPKLVVTSNAESFNKNKTLIAPANCISAGKTEQACSDVYVDCDTNYTITWTNVKTGKEDRTWCDYNNDNKYLIKSWIKQNNSNEQRKIKVTLTAENLSFTYYIVQEGTTIQTNAVNSVDYASEIRVNNWDETRISALDTAKNAVYFEWIAPYTFSTHKSHQTGTFNKVYSVDGYIYNSDGEQHTTQSSKEAKNTSWVFYQGKTYRGIPYTMTNRLCTPDKWKEKLLTAQNGSDLSKTGLDCTSFGSYVTFGNPSGVTTHNFYDKSISISITKSNGKSAAFYGMKNNVVDDAGNIKWKRYNNIPNSDAEWEIYATHPADIYNVLKPGDAVVYRNSKGGHMMIFVGKEKECYYFYEATPAITQYTSYSAKSLWETGYQPFYATIYND